MIDNTDKTPMREARYDELHTWAREDVVVALLDAEAKMVQLRRQFEDECVAHAKTMVQVEKLQESLEKLQETLDEIQSMVFRMPDVPK